MNLPVLIRFCSIIAKMSAEEAMEQVGFEWPGDRSVKVKIRDTILTFST